MSTAGCRTGMVLVEEKNYAEIILHKDPQEARKGEHYLHVGKGGGRGRGRFTILDSLGICQVHIFNLS